MKRIPMPGLGAVWRACLGICAAAVLGAGVAPAASPQVDQAIKSIEAVGNDPARLKLFCELNQLFEAVGEKEDEAAQKQIEELIAKIGPEFGAAWGVGEGLEENSEDEEEFYEAVEALAEKCP